jgi:hypothetical protein
VVTKTPPSKIRGGESVRKQWPTGSVTRH